MIGFLIGTCSGIAIVVGLCYSTLKEIRDELKKLNEKKNEH